MPNINDTPTVIVGNPREITATILNGDNLSDAIFCSGNTCIGIQLDNVFDPGDIFFFSSLTGEAGSFYQITDATGTIFSIPSATLAAALGAITPPGVGLQIPLDANVFAGIQNLMIFCSAAQTADRKIKLIMAPILG